MEYAVIDAGQIVGFRNIPDWDNYPERKRIACDEKGDGGPTLRPTVIEGEGPQESFVIEPNQVKRVRTGLPLDKVKADLKQFVDADAEVARLRFITPGAGMAMTYQEKKDQAVAVLAMGEAAANALANNGAADFPTLSASVPIEAASLYAAAQLVISRYEAWAALSRLIESARLNGKKAISDASDAAAARAAYEAITWPTP